MKAKGLICFLLTLLVLTSTVSYAEALEDSGKSLGLSLNTRFTSKHLWRGFDQFKDKGAIQPSLNIDWFGTGFSSTIWSCWAVSSGSEDQEEIDYVMAYSNSLFKDSRLKTDYTVNWIYYDYPNTNSEHKDAQEVGIGLSWPQLIPLETGSLVPTYYFGWLWPSRSNASNRHATGGVHILGLGYHLPITNMFTGEDNQILHLTSELVYNDGMGGAAVDHDWSHAVLGISTDIPFGKITIKPELNYQISMDDSVNENNEFWCALNVLYKF